jgi:predicted transposase YbfD/YdcC
VGKFKKIFRGLVDPRAANSQHDFLEVLFVALAATLCGAEGPSDMERFGKSKEGLLRQILRLRHGIPSHDTFGRVFQALDPRGFEQAFRRFMAGFAKFNKIKLTGILAIDGKALRGAYERGCRTTPLHMVNVWAVEARMSVASRKAPGRNEAAAAVEVLEALCLKHCTITADALHCHRAFAATVVERGGDYVLALKENQSKIYEAVVRRFARAGDRSTANQREPSTHDRSESRRATVIRDSQIAEANDFPGVVAIGRVTSRRRCRSKPADPPVKRYFLLSKTMSAKRLLEIVRGHWTIENQLHWILDVVFDEDACRARKANAAENLAILRRFAINIVRSHPAKFSMRQKLKTAAWDDSFLLDLLTHMR